MNTAIEERTLEIRDVSTIDNQMKVAGYVNKNGSKSEILSEDGVVFQETILPQAFTNALARGNEICFFLEHDPQKILATTKNGTLEVTQDNVGLHMSATIVRTTDGQNAYNLIKSGIITNMSFGFLVNSDIWDTDNVDIPLRTVTDLDLLEVSAVKNPAYQSSTISARSKKNELLDKSKVNFRAKGGVKNMELSNFSIEDLKNELAKRSADEPKADEQPKEQEPKEQGPKVEQAEEGTEDTDKADSLSQRDWYNLTMAICRAKGIQPEEKRDSEDVVSEQPEQEPKVEEKVEEPTEPKDEKPVEDEPKEEESKDVEPESEKTDEDTDKDEKPSEESTDEQADSEDESKDEEPKDVEEKDDKSDDEERSIKEDFSGLDDLLKPIK